MADQLWVSQVSGYRRRGTRLSEIRSLLGERITVRAILEPLRSCRDDADSIQMRHLLERMDFDIAGVCDANGTVIGQVRRADLVDRDVRSHMRAIGTESLLSDGAPLPDVLSALKASPFAFVLVGSRVRGIVSRADINKPPVRVYLFGIISLLEMHLTFWIRSRFPEHSWKETIRKERIEKAHKEFDKRTGSQTNQGLIDCLQFCDKRDLIVSDGRLREELGVGSKRDAKRKLEQVEKLRNLLAHSQQDLSEGSSWESVISLVEWVETLVNRSDELVERDSAARAGDFADELFAAT